VDNYNKLRTDASSAQVQPPKSAWNKLEAKLDHKAFQARAKKKRFINLLMSFAAVGLLLFISIYVYQEANKGPELAKGHIASWEELDLKSDQFFNVTKVQGLTAAYGKTSS